MKDKKKFITIIIFIIVISLVFILSFMISDEEKKEEEFNIKSDKEVGEIVVDLFKVDIKGAVANPGVYEVNSGDRVIDVIEKAGGLLKNANTDYINLSKEVTNEMTIWIYTNKEIEELELGNTIIEYIEKECNCPNVNNSACINNPDSSLININTAPLQELMTLSGIGESKAKAIIEYREKTPFTSTSDIMNVSGIGESAFEKIKDYITI